MRQVVWLASEAAFCESTFSICNRENRDPEALQRFGMVCRNKASQSFRWALRAAPLYRPSRVLVCKGSTFPLQDGAFPKTAESPEGDRKPVATVRCVEGMCSFPPCPR